MKSVVLALFFCCVGAATVRCTSAPPSPPGDGTIADSGRDATDSAPPADSHSVDVSTAADGSDAAELDTGSVTDTSPDDADADSGGLCIVQYKQPLPPCTPQNEGLECFDYTPVNGAYVRCCDGQWLNEPTDAGWMCPPTPDAGSD
jgi:hypothetical protein